MLEQKEEGELIVVKRSFDEGIEPPDCHPCYHCLGFYKKNQRIVVTWQ